METLFKDLRYGWRVLYRNPASTLIAVLTLAIGIGANAALFSVINGVLLKSLPIKDPDHVAFVWYTTPRVAGILASSSLNYRDLKEQTHAFSGLAGRRALTANFSEGGEPERITGEQVTADYFKVLGVDPLRGRDFLPGEDKVGGEPLVLLSWNLWQRHAG